MKLGSVLLSGFLAAISVSSGIAQILPELNPDDFQIVSVLPDSKVVALSGGSSFYCTAEANSNGGYISIHSCVPFVFQSDIEFVDATRVAAEAVAAANASANQVARATKITAEQAILQNSGITLDGLKAAILDLASRNGCELHVGLASFYADEDMAPLLLELGVDAEVPKESKEAIRNLSNDALNSLVQDGKIAYLESSTKIRVEGCP